MASFSDRLKELRNARGMTQQQMADTFGMQVRNYQRIEASDSPSNETLLKFADYFEVSTDYLLGRDKYWVGDDGHMRVKVPPDIYNTDTEEIKKQIAEVYKQAIAELKKKRKAK